MPLRGMTVVIATADAARFRSALGLAAAQAALGARARLLLDAAAVPLAGRLALAEEDRLSAAGLPTTDELLDTCLELGVEVLLCQSGLALAGLDLAALDPRLRAGGMVEVLATLADDRLVVV